MRVRHRLPRLRHLGLLEASIVPTAEGPGQWWPRRETVTNGRPCPICPTTQATHRAPTRRAPEATTQGSGDASTPEGFQNLAWRRFRETGRSRTLAPNRAAAVLFLSPLDPKARPPGYPAAATSQRKRAPAARTAPAEREPGARRGRGRGGARRAGGGARSVGGAEEARAARAGVASGSKRGARGAVLCSERAGLRCRESRVGAALDQRGAHEPSRLWTREGGVAANASSRREGAQTRRGP